MPVWSLAFSVALFVALITVARCRRLALNIGFVDIPDYRKSHRVPVPYLGGVGLILGVVCGLIFEYPISSKVMLVLLAATLLGTIGLLDDDRTVSPVYRFAAEVAAASAATGAGLRIHLTSVPIFDILLTVVWIVGITNALNLLDNMDGLAAGLSSIAAAAVFALAIASGQPLIATVSAATVGACIGFLIFNRPPASIFMGDAGSLFLGFLLAVITLDVDVALPSSTGFFIPLVVLAVPVLDTTTVTLARLRRRQRVSMGGRDHLSHRLVARGSSPKRAVGILLAVEALLAVLAVLAGRKVVPLSWVLLATVVVLGALSLRTARAQVYLDPVVGLPRWLRWGLVAVFVGLPLLAAPAALALVRASGPARAGAAAAADALRALETGDQTAAVARFQTARTSLAEAKRKLGGPVVGAGLAVPGISSNLRAAKTLVSIGYELARQGELLIKAYGDQSVAVTGGFVPLDQIRELEPRLEQAQRLLVKSRDQLANIPTAFVVPPLADALATARHRVEVQVARTGPVVQMAKVLPDVLGGNGPRHYFLAFQNNAELRGSGGFLGNWGELEADGGRLRITRFGRLEDLIRGAQKPLKLEGMDDFLARWREFDLPATWQQVNVSPDFPTTARVISQLYPQSGGEKVDGVIAVDSFGLAGLLDLTGPVKVPNWSEPISSANVVNVTLRDAYATFRQDERVEFLGDVAHEVAESLTHANIGSPGKVGTALSKATREQHVKVYMQVPAEQRLMEMLGAGGAIAPVQGDSLMLVDQNMAANKIDYYLKRSVAYDVQLQPADAGREAKLAGRVRVDLQNSAPATGLPQQVIGPYDKRFRAGENRSYLSLYTPFSLRSASVNGQKVDVTSDQDLGRSAHSVVVSIPALEAISLDMELSGTIHLSRDGWYRLDLLRQPSVSPDDVTVSVSVPSGWRVVEARNAQITGPRTATVTRAVTEPGTIWVRVERTGFARIWSQLMNDR